MGWICLAMSMGLVFPNGSRIYEYLHALELTQPFLVSMFAVGTGMIHASVTGHVKLRFSLLTFYTAIWAFQLYILFINGLGHGPLAAISAVLISHSIFRLSDLGRTILNPDEPRLR